MASQSSIAKYLQANAVYLNMNWVWCLMYCILICVLLPLGLCEGPCPLYGLDSPGLRCLQHYEVIETIADSEKAWMVEFYAHWCPHCQRFAEPFKALAVSLQDWSPILRVGVFDCAQSQKNSLICQKFGIMGVPTIKFFRPLLKNPLDYNVKIESLQDFRQIKYQLVFHILTVYPPPKHWPNMRTLLTGLVPDSPEHKVLVFEDSTRFQTDGTGLLGAKLILDLVKYPNIKVFRISASNKDMVRKYAVSTFPTVTVVQGNDLCSVTAAPQEKLKQEILDCVYAVET